MVATTVGGQGRNVAMWLKGWNCPDETQWTGSQEVFSSLEI